MSPKSYCAVPPGSLILRDLLLVELALANIAVADDYAEWLIARRGTVDHEADLEF